jgi:hypothetical protein
LRMKLFSGLVLFLFLVAVTAPAARAQAVQSDVIKVEEELAIEPVFDRSLYYAGEAGYVNVTFMAERAYEVHRIGVSLSYYTVDGASYSERNRYYYGKLLTVREFQQEQTYQISEGGELSIIVHFELPSDVAPGFMYVRFKVDYVEAPVMPPIVLKHFTSEPRLIFVESPYKRANEILQTSLLQLAANYTDLETRHNNLQSAFDALTNDFNNFKNLTYALVVVVVALAACTVYAAMKSRKAQPS